MEKLIEGIIFGIPRPVRAYFYISSKKTNELIPKQKKEINNIIKEIETSRRRIEMSVKAEYVLADLYMTIKENDK